MQRYLLPLAVLLETMRGLHATMTLRARLSALPKGWDGECIAEIVVVQGQVQRCTISTVEGQLLLQHEAALQMLERVGDVEWSMAPPSPLPPSLPGQPPAASLAAPPGWNVVPPWSAESLTTLSHRHKQVLLLVEGGKQPEDIARLLRLSLPDVAHLLEDLERHHVVFSHHCERSHP